jgi:hypothetical protein
MLTMTGSWCCCHAGRHYIVRKQSQLQPITALRYTAHPDAVHTSLVVTLHCIPGADIDDACADLPLPPLLSSRPLLPRRPLPARSDGLGVGVGEAEGRLFASAGFAGYPLLGCCDAVASLRSLSKRCTSAGQGRTGATGGLAAGLCVSCTCCACAGCGTSRAGAASDLCASGAGSGLWRFAVVA